MFNFSLLKEKVQIKLISTNLVIQSKHTVRDYEDDEDLSVLVRSIKDYGILEPILVKKLENDIFEVISGNRRLLAAKKANLDKIPAIIIDECEKKLMIFFLSENLHHKKLHFFEEADALFKLIEEYNFTQDMIANSLGLSSLFVTDRLKLLKLGKESRNKIMLLDLDINQALLISELDEEYDRLAVIEEIKKKKLDISKTKEIIENYKKHVSEKSANETIYIIKDIRLFDNTITQAIDVMNKSGLETVSIKGECDEFIEYIIKIPKKKIYLRKTSSF